MPPHMLILYFPSVSNLQIILSNYFSIWNMFFKNDWEMSPTLLREPCLRRRWGSLFHQDPFGGGGGVGGLVAQSWPTPATPWTVAHQAPLPWDCPGTNTEVGCHFLLPRPLYVHLISVENVYIGAMSIWVLNRVCKTGEINLTHWKGSEGNSLAFQNNY